MEVGRYFRGRRAGPVVVSEQVEGELEKSRKEWRSSSSSGVSIRMSTSSSSDKSNGWMDSVSVGVAGVVVEAALAPDSEVGSEGRLPGSSNSRSNSRSKSNSNSNSQGSGDLGTDGGGGKGRTCLIMTVGEEFPLRLKADVEGSGTREALYTSRG